MQNSLKKLYHGEIRRILKSVSRSFYLSLKILPKESRTPLSLAYLLARAADTIADTEILEAEKRLSWLQKFKKHIAETNTHKGVWDKFQEELIGPQQRPEEKNLLLESMTLISLIWNLNAKDRILVQSLVIQLIEGMEKDLEIFAKASKNNIICLKNNAELEEYTYHAAGIVGPFWTSCLFRKKNKKLNNSQMKEWGVYYGQGLQYINIIKDISQDLKLGRCYLPEDILKENKINPKDLLDPQNYTQIKPIINQYILRSISYLSKGNKYILSIPRRRYFSRLATLLPLWIGMVSLDYLASDNSLLDPQKEHKISRRQTKKLIRQALLACLSRKKIITFFEKNQSIIESKITNNKGLS